MVIVSFSVLTGTGAATAGAAIAPAVAGAVPGAAVGTPAGATAEPPGAAALAAAAAAGLGVAILPTPLAALHGALRRLAPAAPPIGERTLYAVVPAALRRDPRVRAALAWFDDALAPLRAAPGG